MIFIILERWDLILMMEDSLLNNRIIFLNGEINEESAYQVIAKLLYLDSLGKEDISLYVNSLGGSVNQGLAIIDTMGLIKSDVATYCVGEACSMGAIILSAGTKGKRYSLPNAEIMIHQPSGGARGKSDDVVIHSTCLVKCKDKLIEILAKNTKKSKKEIQKYFINDYFMNSQEALEFGIVDKVFKSN